jgi:hypothetical protein
VISTYGTNAPVDGLGKRVTDWVSCLADSDRLHHTRVPQLTRAQQTVKLARRLVLVGLDTTHEPRVALAKCRHEGVERRLELPAQSLALLLALLTEINLLLEEPLEVTARRHEKKRV